MFINPSLDHVNVNVNLGLRDFKIIVEDDSSIKGTVPLEAMFQDNGADYPTEIPDDFDFDMIQ